LKNRPFHSALSLIATGLLLLTDAASGQENLRADSLKTVYEQAESDLAKAQLADDICLAYYETSLDSSLKYAKLAANFAEAAQDLRLLAQAHNHIGISYLNKSNLMNALSHFQKSYELFHGIGDKEGEAKLVNNLGVIYTETQDYNRAKDKYEISWRLNDELGKWIPASNSLYNISGSHFLLKNYEESLKYADQLRAYQKLHPEATSPAPLYADLFEHRGMLDSARYYLEISLEEQKTRGDLMNLCLNVLSLSRVKLKQGDAQGAENTLNDIYPIITQNEMLEMEFSYLNLKAEILAAMGKHSTAYQYQKQALDLNDSIDHLNQMNMINDMSAKYETDRMESQITEQQGIIESKQIWLAAIIIVAIVLVCGLFGVIYTLRRNRRLNELLKMQNLQINHQRQKIISSINYAKRIQQSTLPKEHDFKKLFKDSFIYFKPKDIISGDFYAYQQIENKIYVAAVDCTGHGVPGAFMSLIANSKLNKVVNELGERDPGRILTSLHKEIQLALNQESSEDHAMDGVEMSLCAIDTTNHVIEYAGAGSSIFIVRDGNIHEYKGNFSGLGGVDYTWKKDHLAQVYQTQLIKFDNNDMLYLFSDGIYDQIGGVEQKKLNKKLFKEHILRLSQGAFENAVTGCEKFISDWRKHHQQTDDMMLIGIKL
jgi:serine phosphatase RsbU (regulator of sigma subunit)